MARDERFRRGIESAVTVRTQAFQLWANRAAAELGWKYDENSVAGCYVEPLDTYCDMTHLLPRESWQPADGTKTIGYFCGVLDDRAGETHEQATERAKQNAIEFVERDLGTLWPGAAAGGTFDWSVLVDRDDATGPARFDSQYWRANTSPWERYVLTPAGSVEHRLPSERLGLRQPQARRRLDPNGIDGGCVEAAVISGMDAAAGDHRRADADPGRQHRLAAARSRASCRLTSSSAAAPPRRPRSPARAGGSRACCCEGDERAHRDARGPDVQRPGRRRRGVPRRSDRT